MAQTKEERVVEIIVNGTKANASLKEMAAAAAVLSNQVAKIAADDPKRAELIAQLQQMRQRITDARAEVSGLVQSQAQLAAAQAATVAEQARAIAAGKASTASLSEMKTAAGLLEKQLHELSAADPGRAALIGDFQTLKARLGEARQEIEHVAKSEAQLRAEQDALKASQVQLVVNGQKVSASLREMREAAGQLEKELDELAHDDPARGPLIASLQQLKARIREVGEEVAGVSETTSHLRQVMLYAFGSVVGGGIEGLIDKVVETGKVVFETTAKFETYGVVLEKALGSRSLARQAMADIQKMAAETPFSVDELTSSFVKLANRGLTPTMEEMTKLGDLASSQGKSFDQLTEAVLDAVTGEFERLKEFGIAASKSGDQVSLSFKGVNQTVANTPEAIQGALLALGDLKSVAGGMDAISKTLAGSLSNVGDTADQVAVEWGGVLRPAFVAVLDAAGLVLGVLRTLPEFLRENKTGIGLLALALLALNAEQLKAQALALRTIALDRLVALGLLTKTEGTYALAMATEGQTVAQWRLNAALNANPIGAVIMLLALLAFGLRQLYDRSETFRAAVNSLFRALGSLGAQVKPLLAELTEIGEGFRQLFGEIGGGQVVLEVFGQVMAVSLVVPLKLVVAQLQLTIDALAGFWDMGKRVANFFGADFEVDPRGMFASFTEHLKSNAKSIGATLLGMREQEQAQAEESNKEYQERQNRFGEKLQQDYKRLQASWQAMQKTARLEELKNQEADLKERLAKTKKDSEQEMRLKQQLVTNDAAQQLENDKKTAAERRIILAEAQDKRVKLAQEFFEKLAKERAAAAKKAAEQALKGRLAEIEAEKLHQEMLAQVRQAALAARGDELVTENAKIYTEGQLKMVALAATAKKEIAQLTGTAKEKAARTLDIEKKLAAELALVRAEVTRKQGEAIDKDNAEQYKKKQEAVDKLVEAEEQGATRQQDAILVPFHASLKLQQEIEEQKYQIRQAAFARELALIESKLGKESAEYKKAQAAQEKDQKAHNKRRTDNEEKAFKAKQDLQKLEMRTAGDVLDFALQLLDQDGEARKKHHGLYVALAAAKIIADGVKEVAQIWEYSAENPANGPSMGAAGIIMGGIQTAVAIARTGVALSQLKGSGGEDGGSYAQGGATGTGAGLAGSSWGQLLALSGMRLASDGRLRDDSGFAVAGVVHEDEYVIPKWQLQDPQVAAVAQWLEARRLRGFADGGATGSGSSGATLPVAAASPATDGERQYAVQTQMLEALLQLNGRLAGVESWQKNLQVHLNLREAQTRTDEYKQVQYNSAIRSKS